jgi:hypothetical protein
MGLCRLPLRGAVWALWVLLSVLFPLSLYPAGKTEQKKKTRVVEAPIVQEAAAQGKAVFAGTDEGLFAVDPAGKLSPLYSGGSVKKILFAPGEDSAADGTMILLGSEGIMVSADMRNWEPRNQGLPVKTIKIFQNGDKTFLPVVQEIKDLKFNPADPHIMVCATKDRVYLTRDQGRSWKNLGAPTYRTNGIKAVAAAFMPVGNTSELTVFLSHSTYGLHYIHPDRSGAQWAELNRGLERLETTDNADEVADIAVMRNASDIFVSQTFRRRIYRLDWSQKKFDLIWSDKSPFGTVDSLYAGETDLCFLYEGTVASVDIDGLNLRERPELLESVRLVTAQTKPHCMVLQDDEKITLSELWLLDEPEPSVEAESQGSPSAQNMHAALNREGIYLPVNHAMDSRSLQPYLDTIQKGALNMIVIDMKDDYGRLRFTPNNPAISGKGRVFRPLDIDVFLADMKGRGIYTIARVVVFKDPELAAKENGRFAVWDRSKAQAWVGYNSDKSIIDERWVDPYSEEVWEYIAATAEELHERGFDEIQFDYIRFPTDGVNLGDARYRWQEQGMDMESAILSFLRHVRARVKAPISIDIYGANGWYRTGARTGQEVELLAPWVDVICPMYYPSHFEQHFLAQHPPELRPWRIYYHGTLRTVRIARGQAIIRPYAQAFFLNVSYDRKYYNPEYVLRQVEGVRAAGSGGLTYWNNVGRYDDLPPVN